MIVRLPTLKAKELLGALARNGFVVIRSSGSHFRLVHRDDANRTTTVPVHAGRDIPRPMVLAILKQARLTVDELLKSL